jgi:hypothetical protein
MSKFYRVLILLTFLKAANAIGIGYPLTSDSLLELQIAKDAPTRMQISGEKISDIFIHPQEAAEVVIHASGSVFILPQIGSQKVYLTVIGEQETAQDMCLKFTDKKPAPVTLIKLDLEKEATVSKQKKE